MTPATNAVGLPRIQAQMLLFTLIACFSSPPEKVALPGWVGDPNVVLESHDIRTHDITVGTGKKAGDGDRVTVHYAGWLTDGTPFDASRDRGAPFSARLGKGEVIEGWDRGVRGMAVGGKRGMILPPELAYGSSGVGNIPPNAVLVFEIELLELE